MAKLTKEDRRRLDYVARRGASETSESPSSSLVILAARGLVRAGPWRREKSPKGSKIWTVRDYTITEAGARALAEGEQHGDR